MLRLKPRVIGIRLIVLLIVLQAVSLSLRAGVLLSEVMGDPSCSEYYAEFLELYCVGPDSVELQGYSVCIDGETDQLLFPTGESSMAPGRRALVLDAGYAENSDCYEEIIPDSVLRLTIDDAAFGRTGIPNSRAVTVQLLDAGGACVSQLEYPGEGPAGLSRERITLNMSGQSEWTWSLVEHGTPGLRNSVEPDSLQAGWLLVEGEPPQVKLFNNGLLPLVQVTGALSAFYGSAVAVAEPFSCALLSPGDTVRWQPS